MTECSLSWWQTEQGVTLLIFILSALFGVIGWFFKTWWEGRKPYKRDQETFEKIKKIFDDLEFAMIEIKDISPGCFVNKDCLNKIKITFLFELTKAEYFFENKKINKCFNELHPAFNSLHNIILNLMFSDEEGHLVLDKNYQKVNLSTVNREIMLNKYNQDIIIIENSAKSFIKIFNEFIINATKELYKERVN